MTDLVAICANCKKSGNFSENLTVPAWRDITVVIRDGQPKIKNKYKAHTDGFLGEEFEFFRCESCESEAKTLESLVIAKPLDDEVAPTEIHPQQLDLELKHG